MFLDEIKYESGGLPKELVPFPNQNACHINFILGGSTKMLK